jgi:hypothetical protein
VKAMLKIEKIDFIDKRNQTYTIKENQLEAFPLVGGEAANMITTKVWNEHGNTLVNAFMESFDGELIFAIRVANLREEEVEAERRKITSIFNPLNEMIKMQITLNSGAAYNRDISIVTAPIFPIGFQNRNHEWQKVQLLFEANNPFYYSDDEIVESFLGVEPLFQFPFVASNEDPFYFGNIVPNNVAVNKGQVAAPIEIRIKGACVNPQIKNETTGEFIRFRNLTMSAQDELFIDTTFGQKKVLLNGENVFNKLDFASTFFNLAIGENEISFIDETASNDATITFNYRSLYITI